MEVSRPKVILSIEGVGDAKGEFHRFASPRTADAILRQVPIGGRIVRYGEEVYFQISVKAASEKPRETVEVGTIGYWPMGSAVCVFYGPTKPYSPVNKLGRITEGLDLFRGVREGTIVTIRRG
ncbi:MAG TPA: cyclophilin-like fold protein [Candidatus Bathyarchaeia archaeon]